jgi:hypothetical protein
MWGPEVKSSVMQLFDNACVTEMEAHGTLACIICQLFPLLIFVIKLFHQLKLLPLNVYCLFLEMQVSDLETLSMVVDFWRISRSV